ncbi:MAG: DUF3999 family protein [Planctomycetaceae bacterium]
MIRRRMSWVVLICALTIQATADEPNFQFSRAVQSPLIADDELFAIELDADIYSVTQEGLHDLRLLNSEGDPVPYLLRRVRTKRLQYHRSTWTPRAPSLRPLEDGSLEMTVELSPKDQHPNGLTIVTPLRDFERRVRIQTSADGQTWDTIVEDALIFDYSRYMDVRQVEISFPETGPRHFRITVDNVTVRQEQELLELTRKLRGDEETERVERFSVERIPFRIDRLEFWRETEYERPDEDVIRTYDPDKFAVENDPEQQQTRILVEMGREPLTAFIVDVADRNFSRQASVEVEESNGVRTSWRTIGEATLSRIDFQSLHREQPRIRFPQSRQATYRIVIENRDSPPLEVTGMSAEGVVDELVFLATPDQQYTLLYGSETAELALYDTAPIKELLTSGFEPTRIELNNQQPLADGVRPSPFRWSDVINNPVVLTIVIGILTIALGYSLYQTARQIDNEPTDHSPPS